MNNKKAKQHDEDNTTLPKSLVFELLDEMSGESKGVLEQHLKNGGHPDSCALPNTTLLEMAIDGHNVWAVKLLIDYQANLELVGSGGLTPLARAAQRKNLAVLKTLLGAGADPNNGGNEGKFLPLFEAASSAFDNAIQPLVDQGAVSDQCIGNESIWMRAGAGSTFMALLQAGVDPLAKDHWGRNALHHAATKGDERVIDELIRKHKIDPNVLDNNGNPPLMGAAYYTRAAACRLLLRKGADILIGNIDPETGYLIAGGLQNSSQETYQETVAILKEAIAMRRREDLEKILVSSKKTMKNRMVKPKF